MEGEQETPPPPPKKKREKEKRSTALSKAKAIGKLKAAALLEFEGTTAATASSAPAALLEEELLAGPAGAKGAAVERLALLLLAVGIVAAVEAGAELGVAEDLVGLVDLGHFLLGLLLGHALGGRLVRVESLRHGPVLALDGALVGILVHVEHLVVVLGLGPLQLHVRILQQLLDLGCGRVVFFGLVEGLDRRFVLGRIELPLRFGEETR